LRNTGKFTMADVLAFRMRQRPVRMAAAISTLAVSFFYLLAQMAGAGGLVSLLLGITGNVGQSITIAVVGVLMIVYVLVGGMKGTTWVQIIKAVLLIAGAGLMTLWVLSKYGFSLSDVMGAAAGNSPLGEKLLEPGAKYGLTTLHQDRLHLAVDGPGARHRRPAARADALLHGPDLQGGPQVRGVGDQPDRPVLPVQPGARLRCRRPGRARRHQGRPGGANSAAPLLAYELGGTCCWASSPRSRSQPSSRWSPA
jgi:hypothetical protein